MIALDALEQMHAKPLKLVGADAGGDGLACCIQIGVNFTLAQSPHGHSRDVDCLEQYLAIAHDGNGGVQFMAAAGKGA